METDTSEAASETATGNVLAGLDDPIIIIPSPKKA